MTEIWFWIIAALLLVVAVLFVVVPLWRGAIKNNTIVRDAANLEIFRDQVAEMDQDLANGLLTPELYEQGKRELQARMMAEVQSPEAGVAAARNPLKVLAVVLMVLIPLSSVGLYWKLGSPEALAGNTQALLSGEALAELQQKLDAKPENPRGWLQAARSYYSLGDYPHAVKAYDKLTQLVPDEAMLWTEYADSLAMTQGGSLVGAPTELLNKALALDPNFQNALALAGSAAAERRDFPAAVKYWQALYDQLPDKKSDAAKQVAQGLEQVKQFAAQMQGGKGGVAPQAASTRKERITGTVSLSASVKAKADPADVVYVLARAENGPPMPLAVVRTQVSKLPVRFSLDDDNAVMSSGPKLSDFDKVVVVARISKSGNPMPQAGDLQGTSKVIKPGAKGVLISIDSVLK
jgi:cytochrome c-type biogenesis protein CcmH